MTYKYTLFLIKAQGLRIYNYINKAAAADESYEHLRKIDRYNGKTTVIRFSPEAYDLYKQWYNTGRETMEHASTSYIGITTREGLSIALQHSMSERTFKDWIKTALFKKLDYGTYEKRYK